MSATPAGGQQLPAPVGHLDDARKCRTGPDTATGEQCPAPFETVLGTGPAVAGRVTTSEERAG
ncbi:hypothetical protein ACFPM0_19165 [Pseudonocardia sulfidoxydans]|uniref:hypothetical protein n=1 Tax=Pseudonocardia sulfidoxydans TaxID=54011 RepID=UPI00361B4D7D